MSSLQNNKNQAVGKLSAEITGVTDYLQQRGDIKQAILFGSLAAGLERPDSDIDLAIEKKHPLSAKEKAELIGELAVITGRAVDLIDLKTAGEPILGQILKYGKRLFGSDADYAEVSLKHLYAQADFVPYIDRTLKERRQQWLDT